jgi:hypothetical protein
MRSGTNADHGKDRGSVHTEAAGSDTASIDPEDPSRVDNRGDDHRRRMSQLHSVSPIKVAILQDHDGYGLIAGCVERAGLVVDIHGNAAAGIVEAKSVTRQREPVERDDAALIEQPGLLLAGP